MTETSTPIDVQEVRRRPRFKLREEVTASFAGIPVSVTDISAEGLGLRHSSPVRVNVAGSVKIESPENSSDVTLRARVCWSKLGTTSQGLGYASGVRIEEASDAAAGLLGRLIRALGERDANSLEMKKQAAMAKAESRSARPALLTPKPTGPRITSDQFLLIREAMRTIANHPESAQAWYNRAKYSLAKRDLMKDESCTGTYSRDVIVIWEYLGGKIELDVISSALESLRTAPSPASPIQR